MLYYEWYQDMEQMELMENIELENGLYSENNGIAIMVDIFRLNEEDVECNYILAMNDENEIISCLLSATGNSCQCSFDFPKIVSFLINTQATKFTMYHNHPDGIPEESEADLEITDILNHTFSESSELDIDFLGAFIIARDKWLKEGDSQVYDLY